MHTPSPSEQNDRYITLPQTLFACGNNKTNKQDVLPYLAKGGTGPGPFIGNPLTAL